jgi:hypothetical protein
MHEHNGTAESGSSQPPSEPGRIAVELPAVVLADFHT